MLNDTRMSLDDVLKCGSNLEMSPPCAVTSSRFWVVWAWARPRQGGGSGPGGAQCHRALEEFASGQVHRLFLPSMECGGRLAPFNGNNGA